MSNLIITILIVVVALASLSGAAFSDSEFVMESLTSDEADDQILKLNDGYEMAISSVDIDGNKAILELIKDGQVVDTKVIIAANEPGDTYAYSRPGTSQEIKVHFRNIFRGSDHNLATIDGVLQTSESEFQVLVNDSTPITVASGTPLMLEEGYKLDFGSIDIDGNKAYLELVKDGQVVDSSVVIAANEVDDTFVYPKPDLPQTIRVHFRNAFRGANINLVTIDDVWQASEADPSRVLVNNSSQFALRTGETIKLEEGYELAIKSVDIDGNKAYLELIKDGQVVDSKIIIAANDVDDDLVYPVPGSSKEIRIHVKNAFRGPDRNLATIGYVSQTNG